MGHAMSVHNVTIVLSKDFNLKEWDSMPIRQLRLGPAAAQTSYK